RRRAVQPRALISRLGGARGATRRLGVPPRLRTVDDGVEERHASALEVFFDLVLVVAVAALGDLLGRDTSPLGFVRYGALFVPVWGGWVCYTFYADPFETDDALYRLLVIGAMLAMACVATTTAGAVSASGGSASFAASYLAVRLILVALYARAHRREPRGRPLSSRYLAGF